MELAVGSHGDGDEGQGNKTEKMKEHFDKPILFVSKLGRNQFEKRDVDEDAGGQRLEDGGCDRTCGGGHLLDEQP